MGQGPEPYAHWVQRMCDAFGCLPSAIERERQRQPAGFLDEVIEARHYAHVKAVYDADPKRALGTRTGQLVMEIDAELVNG